MEAGVLGGMIGGLVGVVGGLVGTYASIKNTESPRERQFMVRTAIFVWIGVTLFVILVFVLPSPYKWLIWIPYGICLPLAIVSLNQKQREIRLQERSRQQ